MLTALVTFLSIFVNFLSGVENDLGSETTESEQAQDVEPITYATHDYSGNFTWMPKVQKLKQNKDGSYEVDYKDIPSTCFIANNSTMYCAAILISVQYFLTAADCTVGRSPFSSKDAHGLELACGQWTDFSNVEMVRTIRSTYAYTGFTDLKRARKYNLAIGAVSRKWEVTSKLPALNYPPWPDDSKPKQERELKDFYQFCYLYSKDSSAIKGSSNGYYYTKHAMLIGKVLTRKECNNANFWVRKNEFCLLIDSPMKGPCEFLKGGPVCCGSKGVLEGIVMWASPDNCESGDRYIRAIRVDHYIPFIWNSMNLLPTTFATETVPINVTETFVIQIGETQIQWHWLILACLYCLVVIGVPLLIFTILKCRCGGAPKPQVLGYCNFSGEVFLSFFLMISRVVLYCRLRAGVERQVELKEKFRNVRALDQGS